MKANDIVQPIPGRKTSAGVTLTGLVKCRVIKYIAPVGGEIKSVLELEVLEGQSKADPFWCSRNSSWGGYCRANKTLAFHEIGSKQFHQPISLSPGSVFRVFSDAFGAVQQTGLPVHTSPKINHKRLAGYNPPSDDLLLTIMALT